MYLVPITVPIFLDGDTPLLATDWRRSLVLLRDSLEGRYGPLTVAAPFLAAEASDQPLEKVDAAEDQINLMPLFHRDLRTRHYWLGTQKRVQTRLAECLSRTSVLHGTVEDPLRPFCYSAVMLAAARGVPTILVQDQDVSRSMRDLSKGKSLPARLWTETQARLHERQTRNAARAAGLCLFKGKETIARYGHLANALLPIEDTSYLSTEVFPELQVRNRLNSLLTTDRQLRFGYCGRLVHLKGLDRSLKIIAAAVEGGADLGLDIIGTGPEEDNLRHLSTDLGLENRVRFLGSMPYGPALIAALGNCDALLFNPRMSETPRMFFDAYAAGLPLVADGIDYVLERRDAEGATVVLPWQDDDGAVRILVELDRNRDRISLLTERALAARMYHAADNWYRRRAEATHALVNRMRSAAKP